MQQLSTLSTHAAAPQQPVQIDPVDHGLLAVIHRIIRIIVDFFTLSWFLQSKELSINEKQQPVESPLCLAMHSNLGRDLNAAERVRAFQTKELLRKVEEQLFPIKDQSLPAVNPTASSRKEKVDIALSKKLPLLGNEMGDSKRKAVLHLYRKALWESVENKDQKRTQHYLEQILHAKNFYCDLPYYKITDNEKNPLQLNYSYRLGEDFLRSILTSLLICFSSHGEVKMLFQIMEDEDCVKILSNDDVYYFIFETAKSHKQEDLMSVYSGLEAKFSESAASALS